MLNYRSVNDLRRNDRKGIPKTCVYHWLPTNNHWWFNYCWLWSFSNEVDDTADACKLADGDAKSMGWCQQKTSGRCPTHLQQVSTVSSPGSGAFWRTLSAPFGHERSQVWNSRRRCLNPKHELWHWFWGPVSSDYGGCGSIWTNNFEGMIPNNKENNAYTRGT